ncbi:hypothetical protein [Dyella telluris]|nr:hypothetical protein [Dyella telluris]
MRDGYGDDYGDGDRDRDRDRDRDGAGGFGTPSRVQGLGTG